MSFDDTENGESADHSSAENSASPNEFGPNQRRLRWVVSDEQAGEHGSSTGVKDLFKVENSVELCWRCQKTYDSSQQRCSFCDAKNRSVCFDDGESPRPSSTATPAIVKTVWVFAVLALTSLVFGIVSEVANPNVVEGTFEWAQQSLIWIGVAELVSTVIVLLSLSWIKLHVEWPKPRRPKTVWAASIPILGLAIGLNLGFHFVLRNYLQLPVESIALFGFPELLPWCVLLVCIQPAIVEELFFRHVALGASLEVMSVKSGIMISSLLFAMAHVGTPLSMPYLAVLGAFLAWLRLKSGGLLLPMIFHFAHNLIVVSVL